MDPDSVRIDELRLRVPGLSRDNAGALGREVARRLTEGLTAPGSSTRLGRLELRVRVPPAAGPGGVAKAVATAIREHLR